MKKRVLKIVRRPAMAGAWWLTWWGWRNRPTVAGWFHFVRRGVAERRPVRGMVQEGRVRAAFTADATLRHSNEVTIDGVDDGVVRLVGVAGGADTRHAELVAARVAGVTLVEVLDKIVPVHAASDPDVAVPSGR